MTIRHPIHTQVYDGIPLRLFASPSGRLTLPFVPVTDLMALTRMTGDQAKRAEQMLLEGPYQDVLIYVQTDRGHERLIAHDYAISFLSVLVEARSAHPEAEMRFREASAEATQIMTRSGSAKELQDKVERLLRNIREDRDILADDGPDGPSPADLRRATAYDRWLASLSREQLIWWHRQMWDTIAAARDEALTAIAMPVDHSKLLERATEVFTILDEDYDEEEEAKLGITRKQWFEWDEHGEGGNA
ncbi:hypothetical protein [Asaia lannensis]|uniref:hypothetical protein n=1 Tax=Asaia lannensis TaxID=415421 RepID=UPI0038734083